MRGTVKIVLGCAIALLIALGSIPASLLFFTTPIVAEGQLIKLNPICDTFVHSEAKNKSRSRLDEKNDIVGNYWNTYYKFDLSALGAASKSDINRAKLRLVIVSGGLGLSDDEDCSFNVSYLSNNSWNENISWSTKPNGEEQFICIASTSGKDKILEIDITEFIKKASGFDDRIITLKLSPAVSSNVPVTIASSNYDDPSYRPCLKIALSDAQDPDLATLDKSHLSVCTYVSAAEPDTNADSLLLRNNGILAVDNGSAAYLKFNLEPRNILGAVKSAHLKLRPLSAAEDTKIDIYYLKNNDWNPSSLTYNSRPNGDKTLIKSYNGINISGELVVDVTDVIYNLIRSGEYTASFIIDGTSSAPESTSTAEFHSGADSFGAPKLDITVTDDAEETALAEASANLLGNNASPDSITYNLPHLYTAENGLEVNIKWATVNNSLPVTLPNIFGLASETVSQSGKITRPAYLENAETVRVRAELSVGGSSLKKNMTLTIMPAEGIPNRLEPLNRALDADTGN